MKQLFQSLSNGLTEVSQIPSPDLKPGFLLIRTTRSLVSAGTERMLVEFGKAGLINKARQQPDKLKQIYEKAFTDGLISTIDAVRSKLDQPIPLGYSNVGVVVGLGPGVNGFQLGDRVVSNGPHAEVVAVPQNLCALIPDDVTDDSAAFTVLASIGLQGLRLAQPTLGESFLVSGLGLIGLLTSQLLIAHGCKVFGVDPDIAKCELAETFVIKVLNLVDGVDPVSWCFEHTGGKGVDGALITASTSSSQPLHVAAQSCRQRGRIVLVGVTGLDLRRDLFYKKELSFQVSCSYGPGRYDTSYEEGGHDYPIGFVRWTEQRNFEAVLHSLSKGTLRTNELISHRFSIDQAASAYDLLGSPASSLGILLEYSGAADYSSFTLPLSGSKSVLNANLKSSIPSVGFIGAGNYARRMLIPAFAKAGATFHTIAASSGSGPVQIGRKFGFSFATTDVPSLISDPSCNTVVIATRHDSHASLVKEALRAGKHIFVEKPLCLTFEELKTIEQAYNENRC